MAHFEFSAIGTSWKIDILDPLTPQQESDLLAAVVRRIDLFDKTYSRFRADSLVTEMSRTAGEYTLPDDAKPMFDIYHDLYLRTGGLVTPLVGNLLSDAGYDADYTLQQKRALQQPPTWNEAMSYAHPKLTMKQPVILDFGAAGKGYLIDLVGEVLEADGMRNFCVDAGGDILQKGDAAGADGDHDAPIRVGLENPADTTQAIGVAMLHNGSISGSAHNRRAWGNFSHIINPRTLTSPTEIAAVWVMAKTALVSDAIATALFFVSPDTLRVGTPGGAYDFEYIIMRDDFSIEKSAEFATELFLAGK